MFRLGVTRHDQYSKHPNWVQRLLRGDRISYRLLQSSIPPSPKEIEVFEHISYNMQLASGVFRTTAPGRFRDLDLFVSRILKGHFDPSAPLEVQDWASSDAVTSVEWFEVLRRDFPTAVLTASDLNQYLIEVRVSKDAAYIVDATGTLLQYVQPPFVIRFPERPLLWINKSIGKRAEHEFHRIKSQVDFANLTAPQPIRLRRIPLIHPSAQEFARTNPNFRIAQHSVFEPSETRVPVIRTMNILNRSYFGEDKLRRGAECVWESLTPGGIWIVGRTVEKDPPQHNVSILQKTADGYGLVDRHVDSSEIEDIALSFRR